jgi:hypothetical protein
MFLQTLMLIVGSLVAVGVTAWSTRPIPLTDPFTI